MVIKHYNFPFKGLTKCKEMGFWFENKPSGNPDICQKPSLRDLILQYMKKTTTRGYQYQMDVLNEWIASVKEPNSDHKHTIIK
jgi:hypothetical protein